MPLFSYRTPGPRGYYLVHPDDFREFQRKLRRGFYVLDHMQNGDVVQVDDHVWLMKRDNRFYLIRSETGEEAEISYYQAHSAIMHGIGRGLISAPPEAETYLAK